MPYKDFANGFPLFASEIDQYLMNQAVMTFADASARVAALPAPTEGMITYLEDDNQLYKWTGLDWELVSVASPVTTEGDLIVGDVGGSEARLPIGGNGSLLYSNGSTGSWLANSGVEGDILQVSATGGLEFVTPTTPSGGGLTLISSGTPSSTGLIFSSIPQTYKSLLLIGENLSFSSATRPIIYLRNGSTNLDMYTMNAYVTSAAETISRESSIRTSQIFQDTDPFAFNLQIWNYASTVMGKTYQGTFRGLLNGSGHSSFNAGGSQSTSAVDSINISATATLYNASGTIYLYGVN